MRKIVFPLFLILSFFAGQAQEPPVRTLSAIRTTLPIKIDGTLRDEAWKNAPMATDFIEQRPTFGKVENKDTRTEVFVLYDDIAVYIGGICRERSRDSISKELGGRDNIGINDFAGVIFDTYEDKINGSGFFVTPLNEQFDVKYSLGNEDGVWSTVYESATNITDSGWTFELMIPYSAIRFSKEKVQSWGLHILRRRTKTGQQYSWSPLNPEKFGLMNQAGTLVGIKDIKPPLRLSFSPYFSSYANRNPFATDKKWSTSVNGGMDVKFGISKGFTLDMTLIPDFGQVQSDNQVLNLTPFEVRYNENRSFFTEGTELFNKGNLFYSRRVGGTPLHYNSVYSRLKPNEKIVKNPSETKLINATKVSGRTAGGLGIGFFNAVTNAQYATVEDDAKQQYKLETSPLTNYNILVLDQTMKHNSSVTLVNTNVLRNGSDYDANVTAVLWDLYDKNINWNVWGQVTNSRLMGVQGTDKTQSGYHYNLFAGKFKGPFNFEVHRFYADDKYNQRDLGFFNNNNYLEHGFWAGYKWLKPKGFYNNLYLNLRGNYSEMMTPRKFQYFNLNANINGQLKNLWNVGISTDIKPEQQDFYEPRVWGKMVKLPASGSIGFWINTNRAKKYSAGTEAFLRTSSKYHSTGTEISLYNNYRFSDKFSVGLSNYAESVKNNLGFGFRGSNSDSIIFGLRDRHTVENIFTTKYSFTNRMGLTFRARHYWSKVAYKRFFSLKEDGYLQEVASVNNNPDNNVNFFNIDMVYTWQFAQGSFINIAWKTAAEGYNQYVKDQYYRNLRSTIGSPQQNNFSVKIIYFLDYLSIKKQLDKKVPVPAKDK